MITGGCIPDIYNGFFPIMWQQEQESSLKFWIKNINAVFKLWRSVVRFISNSIFML